MILTIVRLYSHLISTISVCMGFNITMPIKSLQVMQVQMMQVRVVTHGLHCGIKPYVVAAMQSTDLLTYTR